MYVTSGHYPTATAACVKKFGLRPAKSRDVDGLTVGRALAKSLAMDDEDSSRYVRSVDRAIDALEALARSGRPMSLAEIVRAVDAPKSTTLNIVRTLVRRHILEVGADNKRYRAGHLLIALARQASRGVDLARIGRPYLERLAQETGESTLLGVETKNEIAYVEVVRSPQPIQYVVEVGTRRPLHCASGGKLFLALKPESAWQTYVEEAGLFPYTKNTITDPAQFRAELTRIKDQGYAISESEVVPDLMGIAVPVLEGEGGTLVGVMVVTGPQFRLRRRPKTILNHLKEAAQSLTRDLAP